MAIDPEKVAQVSMRALMKAQKKFETLTGWFWITPEYVATVSIMDAVSNVEDVDWVIPEYGIRETLHEARGGIGQPPKALPKQGRFDIVVYRRLRPNGVIEVKTRSYGTITKDVRRVCAAIQNARNLRWGVITFSCISQNGTNTPGRVRVENMNKSLFEKAVSIVNSYGMKLTRHQGRIQFREEGAWRAESYAIRQK